MTAATEVAPGLPFVQLEHWYDAAGLADLLAARLRDVLTGVDEPTVLFTAHSVPVTASAAPIATPTQMRESAELVAAAAGLADVGAVGGGLAERRADGAGVARSRPADDDRLPGRRPPRLGGGVPIGFVADHLEVLYDLDIEAAARAATAACNSPERPRSTTTRRSWRPWPG